MSKSIKQKEALANSRNKELDAVRKLDPQFSCQGDVGTFIGLYLQSEVFAKKLQRYYRTDTNKNSKDELNITALKAALDHFKLDFSDADLPKLFKGGPGKQNEKSARQLRNGYLHSLSSNDKKEIQKKASKFNSELRKFLSIRVPVT
ncbi:hypothetical protein [Shewanella algidipiscicola]|uniref:Uncharacterized protein n=1 Tax=Shewanella algidipiscicola TaxID=614070 RepID=A0ABQ4PDG0_9GAMM|nr:hypothetical protein [Shewanella algidipiscicola]GIU45161.1 hypothetical protein TUM4630_12540 [Shewanella algidipiscicola]